MLEQLYADIKCESYQFGEDSESVVDLDTIKRVISKHSYLKLGDFIATVAPYQLIAIKAGTTVSSYDVLCTAQLELNGAVQDSFKNISHRPFDLNVAKVDVRDDLFDGEPVLYIFVN